MNKQKYPNYTDDDINSYLETPWNIIESYFEGKHLKQMVRHQLESYFFHSQHHLMLSFQILVRILMLL